MAKGGLLRKIEVSSLATTFVLLAAVIFVEASSRAARYAYKG